MKKNYFGLEKFNDKIVVIFNSLNKKYLKININNKYKRINVIKELHNDIISRRMSNRLLIPHYFFTRKYNEHTMPSQVRI